MLLYIKWLWSWKNVTMSRTFGFNFLLNACSTISFFISLTSFAALILPMTIVDVALALLYVSTRFYLVQATHRVTQELLKQCSREDEPSMTMLCFLWCLYSGSLCCRSNLSFSIVWPGLSLKYLKYSSSSSFRAIELSAQCSFLHKYVVSAKLIQYLIFYWTQKSSYMYEDIVFLSSSLIGFFLYLVWASEPLDRCWYFSVSVEMSKLSYLVIF